MQGGYGSHRGSRGSFISGQAFTSTPFSLCLFGNKLCFTRSSYSSLTDLCALCWNSHAKAPDQRQPAERTIQGSSALGGRGALLLEVSRVLKHHVHGVASCPPLSPGLQGRVLPLLHGLLSREKRSRALLVPAVTLPDFHQEGPSASTPHSHPPPPQIRHLRLPSKDTQKQIDRNN